VLSRGPELLPDIAIVDRELLDGDGDAVLDVLRDRLGRRNFPIIVLADSSIPSDAVYRGEASWTDYLPKPSAAMLRTRVRAWLARTLLVFDRSSGGAPCERVTGSEDTGPLREPPGDRPALPAADREQRDLLLDSATSRPSRPARADRESDPPIACS